MAMHVNLSSEMEGYIKSKVASGFYGNATEVIRDAIRQMQANENRTTALRAALAKGDAQLDRGEGEAYTSELMERITRSAVKAISSHPNFRQKHKKTTPVSCATRVSGGDITNC